MTGHSGMIRKGSTLIGDHKTAVQALEDVLASTTTATAKEIATVALKKIGEIDCDEDRAKPEPSIDDIVTRKQ